MIGVCYDITPPVKITADEIVKIANDITLMCVETFPLVAQLYLIRNFYINSGFLDLQLEKRSALTSENPEEVLEAVGLIDKLKQMPSDLSGGQRKRVGIARTLILKPEIMLYDEPTSGLDPVTSTEINELINEVQQKYNTSSIIITHDLTCAKTTGNRIAMLLDGKFASTGNFNEVFNTKDERVKNFYNYNFIQ